MGYKIVNDGEVSFIYTDMFDQTFHMDIKKLGGKWQSSKKGWKIGNSRVDDAKKLLNEFYGSSEALKIKIVIKKYKVKKALRLFGRNIIVVDQYDNSYTLHNTVNVLNDTLPQSWAYLSEQYNRQFRCYLIYKLAVLFDPFLLKECTLIISNVSIEQLAYLRDKKYSWIDTLTCL